MINSELTYNPYLEKTDILFNRHEPRINSLVEKYKDKKLVSWIREIPQIFHDEMNGYDFDLIFSGTRLDFEELKKAFHKAGVDQDKVRLFHKNKIGEREEKLKLLEGLQQWLNNNKNSHFEMTQFLLENENVFDDSYSVVILSGRGLDTDVLESKGISVEYVDNTDELNDTDLNNTPILICVDKNTLPNLQSAVRYFTAEKKDVIPEQIFFYIHSSVDLENAKRIIQDLGIQEPKIVENVEDEQIMRFIELYPYTDQIVKAVVTLREKITSMQAEIKVEEEKSIKTNAAMHEKLEEANKNLLLLKSTKESFEKDLELQIPEQWWNLENELIDSIANWKKNKTKTTKGDEAAKMAYEFDQEIHRIYDSFIQKTMEAMYAEKEETDKTLISIYETVKDEEEYRPDLPNLQEVRTEKIPSFNSGLMDQKEVKYVTPINDFDIMGIFFKTNNSEKVLETSYYFQKWREYVISKVKPAAERLIEGCFSSVRIYNIEAREIYKDRLEEIIIRQKEDIEKMANSLSAEEIKVQTDIAWLRDLEEKVTDIVLN